MIMFRKVLQHCNRFLAHFKQRKQAFLVLHTQTIQNTLMFSMFSLKTSLKVSKIIKTDTQ